MRSVHADAADGGIRFAIGMPALRRRRAARFSHGAILLDGFDANPGGARGQRAERQRAPHAILAQGIARRRLRLLFGGDVASRQ
jgi:hypothetical protein